MLALQAASASLPSTTAGFWTCTWNAECVGWHVCKVGAGFAALEPIAQGLRAHLRASVANLCVALTLFVRFVRIRNRTMSETISSGGFSSAQRVQVEKAGVACALRTRYGPRGVFSRIRPTASRCDPEPQPAGSSPPPG